MRSLWQNTYTSHDNYIDGNGRIALGLFSVLVDSGLPTGCFGLHRPGRTAPSTLRSSRNSHV